MADLGHVLTDREIKTLTDRIFKMYGEAEKELSQKIKKYFTEFKKLDEERQQWVKAGKWTEEQYRTWRLARIANGKRFTALRDDLAARMTNANGVALEYINNAVPKIYALNRNYEAYRIEKRSGGNVAFNLYDEATVRRLIVDEPDVMPFYPPKRAVNRGIDLAFGKRQITATVTSGILQGKSVYGIADMLQQRISDMSRTSAVRAARTAATGAQNGGRMATYYEAKKKGIRLKKTWVATLDSRTRDSHAAIDGETVDIEKPFSNGCMYPGDPNGAPAEVYNCRCTMIAELEDSPYEKTYTAPDGTKAEYRSFKEWQEGKLANGNVFTVANNANIKYNKINISDKQFGKKAGKHAKDYGLNPDKEEDRERIKQIISEIHDNPEEVRYGTFRGQKQTVVFYIRGEDVVVQNAKTGEFVTIMKGGINNARVKNAGRGKI